MRGNTPSGKIAGGSPDSVETSISKPTYLPPGAEGILVLRRRFPSWRQRTMSEIIRTATTGGPASPASRDLKASTPDSFGDGSAKSVLGQNS